MFTKVLAIGCAFIICVAVIAQGETQQVSPSTAPEGVAKWEYKSMVVTDLRTTEKGLGDELNEASDKAVREFDEKLADAGKLGWELVSVTERFSAQPSIRGASTTTRYFLKRRLP